MTRWLMQARSSSSGELVGWSVEASVPDWDAQDWPGPGSAQYIAATKMVGYLPAPVQAPIATDVSPDSGTESGGTEVVITGSHLTGVAHIYFGDAEAASFVVDSDTQITAVTSAGSPGLVDLTLVNFLSQEGNLADAFEYTAAFVAPTLTSVSPNTSTSNAGGESVTLTGTDFTGATGVTFEGRAATSVVVVNDTTITCVTPSGGSGAVSVVVTNPAGSNAPNTAYTYWSPAQIAGVSLVLESGKELTPVPHTVATLPLPTWGDQSGNNHDTVGNVGTVANAFGVMPGIVMGDVSHYVGVPGGSIISVTGGMTVFFVAKWTSSKTVRDRDNTSYAGTPLNLFENNGAAVANMCLGVSAGNLAVSVKSGSTILDQTIPGSSGLNDGSPQFIGFSISAGGEVVGLVSGRAVGSVSQPMTGVVMAYQNFGSNGLDCFTGTVGVIIVVEGIISSADRVKLSAWSHYRFGTPDESALAAAPNIASLSPAVGDTAGGDTVVITGTDFTGATAVSFGGTAAASFVVNSSTQITAVTAAHTAGTVSVVVTTPAGTDTLASSFEYWSPAVLAPSVFYQGNYAVAGGTGTWTPRSFTVSNPKQLATQSTVGKIPAVVNGGDPEFVAANDTHLMSGAWWADLVGLGTAFTIIAVLDIDAINSTNATLYQGDGIIIDQGQWMGMTLGSPTQNKATVFTWPTSGKYASVSLGSHPVTGIRTIAAKLSTNLKITADGATWVTGDASGAAGTLTGFPRIGGNQVSGTEFSGRILALVVDDVAWSDADITKFYAWAAARFS